GDKVNDVQYRFGGRRERPAARRVAVVADLVVDRVVWIRNGVGRIVKDLAVLDVHLAAGIGRDRARTVAHAVLANAHNRDRLGTEAGGAGVGIVRSDAIVRQHVNVLMDAHARPIGA